MVSAMHKTYFNPLVIQRALQQIKAGLRQQKISYAELASRLNVSLNTVKRLLNGQDISLQRLLQLVDICQLDWTSLLQTAVEEHAEHHFFSEEQDQAFAAEPALLDFFVGLFYQQRPLNVLADAMGLDDIACYQRLRKLEMLGLLELEPGNRFRFKVKPPLGFAPGSRVLQQQLSCYFQRAEAAVLNQAVSEETLVMVKPLRLPPQSFRQLSSELKRVIDKYAEASELMYGPADELPEYQLTLVAQPLMPSDHVLSACNPTSLG